MQPLLIAGTDTGVGKTVVTAALAAYWQTYHTEQSLGIYKPIQSGEGDREYYQQTFNLSQTLEEITPLYFTAPLAPAIAAEKESKIIDLGLIWQQFQVLQQQKDCLLVETLGGLGSPITYEYIVADLARDWHLPTVLVVPVRLGSINQAVANTALASLYKVNLVGIVLSCAQPFSHEEIEDWASVDLIQNLTSVPVIGMVSHLNDMRDLSKLAYAASNLTLERLGFG